MTRHLQGEELPTPRKTHGKLGMMMVVEGRNANEGMKREKKTQVHVKGVATIATTTREMMMVDQGNALPNLMKKHGTQGVMLRMEVGNMKRGWMKERMDARSGLSMKERMTRVHVEGVDMIVSMISD